MPKPTPTPKPQGRPPAPVRSFQNITLTITPEDAAWLAIGGNASYKAREVFREKRERESAPLFAVRQFDDDNNVVREIDPITSIKAKRKDAKK